MVIKLNKRNNKNKKCDKEEPVNNAKRKAGITSEINFAYINRN